VDGYAITQLTSDPADDIQPRFSPDGKKVVFCSNRSGNWDIWIVERDGAGMTQLTRDQADEVAPCWSPDGTRIAFCTWGRRSHQWELWEMAVAEPGVRRFLAFGMFPDWSPDGRHIAFQRARQRDGRWFSIWTIELADGDVKHPTEVAFSDDAACIAPHWSPDGKRLVYCAIRNSPAGSVESAPGFADLWMVEAESGLRMKLTDGGAPTFNPVWASSGRVYFVSSRAGTDNIWSVAVTRDLAAAAPQQKETRHDSQGHESEHGTTPGGTK
jgi:TolB protein